MLYNLSRIAALGGILGVVALAGCAGSSSNQSALPGGGLTGTQSFQQPMQGLIPDLACPQTKTEPIKAAGGTVVFPACDGFSGKAGYPKNNAPAGSTTTLTSYSQKHMPPPSGGEGTPSQGTVIAWISSLGQSSAGSITFCNFPTCAVKNASLKAKGTLMSPTHSYELFVYAFGIEQGSESLGSPVCAHGSCTLTFASPLTGQTVPQGITLWFELDDLG